MERHISFRSNAVAVVLACMTAALVSAAVYPEIFFTFKMSFVIWYDYCVDYPMTFVLTKFLYQGGLQLWNVFGQQPFFHAYGVEGFFKLPNVVTALTYYALQPAAADAARLFHHVFTWSNLMTLLFVRVAGSFLLLTTVTRDRRVLFAGSVLCAVFFSQFAFLRGQFYMSCFPLGMYFIVRYVQTMEWRYGLGLLMYYAVCLGSGVLHGAYLYLPLHFFMLAGVLWRLVFHVGRKRGGYGTAGAPVPWAMLALVLLAGVLILAPYVFIVKVGFNDIAFDQEHSRISHMFNPSWYFQTKEMDTQIYYRDALNPFAMFGTYSMYYAGWAFTGLALIGVAFSRNRLKWFFVAGLILLWLLGQPRDHVNAGTLVHWINALTNPLKAIVRSYQNACQPMLPVLLMPLAVLGFEVVRDLAGRTKRGTWIMAALCVLAAVDVGLVVYQTKKELAARCLRKTVTLEAAPGRGEVPFDYVNPALFTFRHSYELNFSYYDEMYLWFPQGTSSVMRQVINQGLNYTYLNGYNPRHAIFKNLSHDIPTFSYLSRNSQFVFLAPVAVNESPEAFARIAESGLSREVATVLDPSHALRLPNEWSVPATAASDAVSYREISARVGDEHFKLQRNSGDTVTYSMKLPSHVPEHLATSLFSKEQVYLRLCLESAGGQWRELAQAEGELIHPYTFDVNNIKKGRLTVLLPAADVPFLRTYHLLYPSPDNEGVQEVWRRQFDHLGLTYHAKKSGWLVCHYPYDPKFRIAVDGKYVPYYRTNKKFIGFPLTEGTHKILIEYWPGSWLKPALLLSAVITSIGFPVLIALGLRWEREETERPLPAASKDN